MEPLLAAIPTALAPPYREAADKRSVHLYRGPARWRSRGVDAALPDVLVYVDLLPTPHLRVDGRLPAGQALGDWFSPVHRIDLPPMRRVPVPPESRLPELREGEGSVTQDAPRAGIRVGVRRSTRHVDFVVLNYLDVVGAHIRHADGSLVAGRLQFEGQGWRVTIDPVADQASVLERLQSDGGVGITHTGRLERSNGEVFAPAVALEILECLHYLLWFSKGSSCAPLLHVGHGRTGAATWAHWTTSWVESYATPYSWLDSLHAVQQLNGLFPLFLTLWQDPRYNAALRVALRNYLDANAASPIESGIALAQLALESLAYAHLVSAAHDPAAFGRNVPANVTLRRLLRLLHVPTAIPPHVRTLRDAQPASWTRDPWDGASAVTWLRNYAMHGERSIPGPTWSNWLHGWLLSCWYVEMSIFALCGYRGVYRSRVHSDTWTGSVRRVPWARAP